MSEVDRIEIGHLKRGVCVLKDKLKAERRRNAILIKNVGGLRQKCEKLQEQVKAMEGGNAPGIDD